MVRSSDMVKRPNRAAEETISVKRGDQLPLELVVTSITGGFAAAVRGGAGRVGQGSLSSRVILPGSPVARDLFSLAEVSPTCSPISPRCAPAVI